jgi:hypothetical protein
VIKMSGKKNSPESGKPLEELSLRERLALKANMNVDKMPTNANSLYENTLGGGKKQTPSTFESITSIIGTKRRNDDEYDLNMQVYEPKPLDVRSKMNRNLAP